jgi:hypothetical protein
MVPPVGKHPFSLIRDDLRIPRCREQQIKTTSRWLQPSRVTGIPMWTGLPSDLPSQVTYYPSAPLPHRASPGGEAVGVRPPFWSSEARRASPQNEAPRPGGYDRE